MLTPPLIVVVARVPAEVVMEIIGVAFTSVEVAMVQAPAVLSSIVVVARVPNAIVPKLALNIEEDPRPKKALPPTENIELGEVVPIPTKLLEPRMLIEGIVVVEYKSDEVPIYRLPPIEEKSQCLRLVPAEVSVSVREGRVPAT